MKEILIPVAIWIVKEVFEYMCEDEPKKKKKKRNKKFDYDY